MGEVPLILVVGGDALAVRVCEELCSTQGHRTALLWSHDHDLARRVEAFGAEYLAFPPNDYDALVAAGVAEAATIMPLSDDDRLNLQVALKARDINPNIRVVLRQFNRTLARKIEQNLPNCSVLSMASHSAASIVGAALDRTCFYALQFPDLDGVLCGFATRHAKDFGITGLTKREAQGKTKMRVIALDGRTTIEPEYRFTANDEVIVFGEVRYLMVSAESAAPPISRRRRRPWRAVRRALLAARHADPIVRQIIAVTLAIFVIATGLFAYWLHRDPITAAYFVAATMTTTGYGDITPLDAGPAAKLASVGLMVTGLALSGVFIAFATAALTRAQFNAIQGMRQIKTRDHVLVCGAGNVGTRVVEFLLALDQRVVVIEPTPDPALIEQSRRRQIELLTGDATRDSTLDLCHLRAARSIVAITNSDTANLEVALGARGRNAGLQVVMRVADETFAKSIARQFEAISTLSTSALAAPAFAGLSRFPGTRGRISFGGEDYNVGERPQGESPMAPPANDCTALGVWRNGAFLHIDSFDEMEPFDRLLFIVPLSQFRSPSPRTEQPPSPLANVG